MSDSVRRSLRLQNQNRNEVAESTSIAESKPKAKKRHQNEFVAESKPKAKKRRQNEFEKGPAAKKPNNRNVAMPSTKKPTNVNKKLTAPVATFLNVPKELLYDIFGQLDLNDLASVARVCTYFQETADEMYLKKYGDRLSFDFISKRGSKKDRLQLIKNAVQSFGPIVNKIKISSIDGKQSEKRNEAAILQEIDKYFARDENDDYQKTLTLERFHFKSPMVPICQSLFGRINKLKLLEIKMHDGAKAAFDNCSNLTDLTIYRSQTNPAVKFTLDRISHGQKKWLRWVTDYEVRDACLDHHFPQLKRIFLNSVGTLQSIDIKEFVRKNPQLQKLSIAGCYSLPANDVKSALQEFNMKNLKLQMIN